MSKPGVASAEGSGMGVIVTGNGGTATIAADITDAQGGMASITFMVIVEGEITRR